MLIPTLGLAFEVLTLACSFLGPGVLAAQSITMTLATLGSQVPVPLSIAASTRVGNLIGSGRAQHARLAGKVALAGCFCGAVVNTIFFLAGRFSIPRLFTDDEAVQRLASDGMLVLAAYQVLEGLATACNGLLRGIGRQVGGYVALLYFYIVRFPIIASSVHRCEMLTCPRLDFHCRMH